MAVTQNTVEEVLVLELVVKGHVMDEVPTVEILAQLNGSLTTCYCIVKAKQCDITSSLYSHRD